MKKKTRNIDGVRVIHRYSPSILIYALLALIPLACSIGTYFLPFFYLTNGSETVATFNPFLDLWKSLLIWDTNYYTSNAVYSYIVAAGVEGTPVKIVTMWCMFFIAFNTYFAALFDVILGIRGLFLLILGKTRHFRSMRKLSFTCFSFRLWQGIFMGGLIAFLMFTQKNTSTPYSVNYMYPAIYLAATLAVTVIMSILYAAIFKECVYRNEIGELAGQKTDNPIQ